LYDSIKKKFKKKRKDTDLKTKICYINTYLNYHFKINIIKNEKINIPNNQRLKKLETYLTYR